MLKRKYTVRFTRETTEFIDITVNALESQDAVEKATAKLEKGDRKIHDSWQLYGNYTILKKMKPQLNSVWREE